MTNIWRGQEAEMTIDSLNIGILQNVEVEKNSTVEELRGAGSPLWQDLQQTELSISVSGEILAFDNAALDSLLDIETDEQDPNYESIRDTAEVPRFTVTGTFLNTDGDQYDLAVKEVYFESLPIGGDKDEWIGITIDGTGRQVERTYTEESG